MIIVALIPYNYINIIAEWSTINSLPRRTRSCLKNCLLTCALAGLLSFFSAIMYWISSAFCFVLQENGVIIMSVLWIILINNNSLGSLYFAFQSQFPLNRWLWFHSPWLREIFEVTELWCIVGWMWFDCSIKQSYCIAYYDFWIHWWLEVVVWVYTILLSVIPLHRGLDCIWYIMVSCLIWTLLTFTYSLLNYVCVVVWCNIKCYNNYLLFWDRCPNMMIHRAADTPTAPTIAFLLPASLLRAAMVILVVRLQLHWNVSSNSAED